MSKSLPTICILLCRVCPNKTLSFLVFMIMSINIALSEPISDINLYAVDLICIDIKHIFLKVNYPALPRPTYVDIACH